MYVGNLTARITICTPRSCGVSFSAGFENLVPESLNLARLWTRQDFFGSDRDALYPFLGFRH